MSSWWKDPGFKTITRVPSDRPMNLDERARAASAWATTGVEFGFTNHNPCLYCYPDGTCGVCRNGWMTDAQIALFYRIRVFGMANRNILRDPEPTE